MSTQSLAEAVHITEQVAAFEALPEYPVAVLRRSTHKDLGETDFGKFTQQTARFSDGAVRLLTLGMPKESYFGMNNISPFPISEGDALFTGPSGLNAEVIERLVELGYPVVWLHHQGRHATLPTSIDRLKTMVGFLSTKSVGKSAHHDHALFDDFEAKANSDFSTSEIIRGGFSRSAMSGEAFVAEAPLYGRTVPYSDLTAKCFAHLPSAKEVVRNVICQGPSEAIGLAKLTSNLICREIRGETGIVKRYAGTLDLHPMNLLHELAWIKPLLSGDDGIYSRAIPLDTAGVRVFLTHDDMSHYTEHQLIHTKHPKLAILVIRGCHIEGACQTIVDDRIERFRRVMGYMRDHDMDLADMTFRDYLPKEVELESAA